tara:strand:- start:74 stop:1117 length:1044 start_codon:yes stop_codon:yes gene_type:complete
MYLLTAVHGRISALSTFIRDCYANLTPIHQCNLAVLAFCDLYSEKDVLKELRNIFYFESSMEWKEVLRSLLGWVKEEEIQRRFFVIPSNAVGPLLRRKEGGKFIFLHTVIANAYLSCFFLGHRCQLPSSELDFVLRDYRVSDANKFLDLLKIVLLRVCEWNDATRGEYYFPHVVDGLLGDEKHIISALQLGKVPSSSICRFACNVCDFGILKLQEFGPEKDRFEVVLQIFASKLLRQMQFSDPTERLKYLKSSLKYASKAYHASLRTRGRQPVMAVHALCSTLKEILYLTRNLEDLSAFMNYLEFYKQYVPELRKLDSDNKQGTTLALENDLQQQVEFASNIGCLES